jgi:hypothetical protein
MKPKNPHVAQRQSYADLVGEIHRLHTQLNRQERSVIGPMRELLIKQQTVIEELRTTIDQLRKQTRNH